MTGRRGVSTEAAPAAIGPYTQAIEAGDTVFTSGQVGLDPLTGELVGPEIEDEARQVFANLRAVLAAAGLGLDDVVKTTVFLDDMDSFGRVNEIYGEHFQEPYPARSTVEVARLPKDARLEVEAVARRTTGEGEPD